MMGLIFRPEGVEPERSDFRILRANTEPVTDVVSFTSWDQIVRYLTERDWPEGQLPWVWDGDTIVEPMTVQGYLRD